jgi:hypothetical protein
LFINIFILKTENKRENEKALEPFFLEVARPRPLPQVEKKKGRGGGVQL